MPFLNAHGIAQYYELRGEGAPIVFIHGALVDHRAWDPQASELEHSHRVLRYDLRGHGRTGPSTNALYTVDLFAEDLYVLIDALGLDHPLLCGLSLGGMIAQTYALRYPISGLVLADTLASVRLSRCDHLIRRLSYPRWLIALAVPRLDIDRFARLVIGLTRLVQGSAWLGTRSATREYIRSCIQQMQNQEVLKTIEAVYRFRAQRLELISCPTLVVAGEQEAGVVDRHMSEIVRQINHARSERIPQAGHISNLDNPSAFNACLRDFLETVSA